MLVLKSTYAALEVELTEADAEIDRQDEVIADLSATVRALRTALHDIDDAGATRAPNSTVQRMRVLARKALGSN